MTGVTSRLNYVKKLNSKSLLTTILAPISSVKTARTCRNVCDVFWKDQLIKLDKRTQLPPNQRLSKLPTVTPKTMYASR